MTRAAGGETDRSAGTASVGGGGGAGGADGPALVLYCDGASRGNPGPAGAGAVLVAADGDRLEEGCRYLGTATNNEAEYNGLILGLEVALRHGPRHLTVRLDSELVVRQLQGVYKVRSVRLRHLHARASRLLARLPGRTIEHIARSLNAEADRLANRAIDEAAGRASEDP